MSQLPDETLRRILAQIQQTAQQSSRNLSLSRAQIAQKEKERRILQLTMEEINLLPRNDDVKLYKGVGKMFINIPRATMDKSLREQEKELSDDISNLNKKSKYLEKQYLEANSQLRDVFHSSRLNS
ncbi:Prefoldin [Cantharellus anzutake]|uniref:Prefoldin n=1 Tax=Cantharellus anzutake TaxID=1750568 RepID=UPI001905FEAB|nr:Prefoldin [Cantharellus anzutake]XP_038917332.1 Prefoldin [Cantharellus anzutake]KAF8314351.1 Prefoldin [Cantharellus anzutake]KAF8333179.1 Prefoldin [Cantharellus anzutake]